MVPKQPLYRPLDNTRREIRLLEILSQTQEQAVICKLHTVSLDSKPYFVCLSYVWGDPSVTEEIVVDGTPRKVTANLAAALKHVKKHWIEIQNESGDASNFRLWADALCINQSDLEERSAQVQLMRSIYSSADSVLSWLSSDDGQVLGAFKFMEETVQAMRAYLEARHERFPDLDDPAAGVVDQLKRSNWEDFQLPWLDPNSNTLFDGGQKSHGGDPWHSLKNLCGTPFWSRVWIQQEIVLAKQLHFLCPSKQLSFGELYSAIFCILNFLDSLTNVQEQLQGEANYESRKVVERMYTLLPVLGLREQSHDQSSQKLLILQAPFGLRATNPLDHVYGLLGLSGLNIVPDYERPVRQVNVEFARQFLERWQSLSRKDAYGRRIGCLLWLQGRVAGIGNRHNLPTWAPDFSEHARLDMQPEWPQQPNDMNLIYRDAPELWDCADVCVIGESLWVTGVEIETVTSCYQEVVSADFVGSRLASCFMSFLTSHGSTYFNGKSLLTVLCCTLMLKEDAQYDIRRLHHLLSYGELFTSRVLKQIKDEDLPFSGETHSLDPILLEWMSVIEKQSGKRLISTKGGYIGLTMPDVQEGDVVWILTGCNVPVVLRPVDNHYLFVGCCFMLGLLHGEVAGLLRSGRAKAAVIEIR
ncbi:hypothetical protein LRP88_00692 [Fusarium phalaenopsidis]|nr:Heterokaryon incompatibility protein [Fusarium sp. Ph1]